MEEPQDGPKQIGAAELRAAAAALRDTHPDLADRLQAAAAYAQAAVCAGADQKAEARRALLVSELRWRVRNILAVVRSLAARTVASSRSLEEFASHFDGRLATLARVHNIFARTGECALDLEELVRDELVAVGAAADQLAVSGPPVRLEQDSAHVVALAIHELATNAVKYGALAHASGRLEVQWRTFQGQAGRTLSFDWRETGVRAIDLKPHHTGFGRDLIERGLPYELGATTSLAFEPGGLRAVIEVPLTDSASTPDGYAGNLV